MAGVVRSLFSNPGKDATRAYQEFSNLAQSTGQGIEVILNREINDAVDLFNRDKAGATAKFKKVAQASSKLSVDLISKLELSKARGVADFQRIITDITTQLNKISKKGGTANPVRQRRATAIEDVFLGRHHEKPKRKESSASRASPALSSVNLGNGFPDVPSLGAHLESLTLTLEIPAREKAEADDSESHAAPSQPTKLPLIPGVACGAPSEKDAEAAAGAHDKEHQRTKTMLGDFDIDGKYSDWQAGIATPARSRAASASKSKPNSRRNSSDEGVGHGSVHPARMGLLPPLPSHLRQGSASLAGAGRGIIPAKKAAYATMKALRAKAQLAAQASQSPPQSPSGRAAASFFSASRGSYISAKCGVVIDLFADDSNFQEGLNSLKGLNEAESREVFGAITVAHLMRLVGLVEDSKSEFLESEIVRRSQDPEAFQLIDALLQSAQMKDGEKNQKDACERLGKKVREQAVRKKSPGKTAGAGVAGPASKGESGTELVSAEDTSEKEEPLTEDVLAEKLKSDSLDSAGFTRYMKVLNDDSCPVDFAKNVFRMLPWEKLLSLVEHIEKHQDALYNVMKTKGLRLVKDGSLSPIENVIKMGQAEGKHKQFWSNLFKDINPQKAAKS